MSKMKLILITITTLLFLCSISTAAVHSYDPLDFLIGPESAGGVQGVTYSFDFGGDFSSITSASLYVYCWDDDVGDPDGYEPFRILAGPTLSDEWSSPTNYEMDSPSYDLGPWNILSSFNGTSLQVRIERTSDMYTVQDDFFFDQFVVAAQGVAPVPIPGAVWLLGSSLIGIGGIRRKFKK